MSPDSRPRSTALHGWNADIELVSQEILDYARNRLRLDPVPLDGPRTFEQLQAEVGQTVTAEGIGGSAALRVFTETLAPACLSIDHPRYLSFIPCAPTEASMLFDLVVGASSIYGGSWLEGAGAVFAENQALAWLAELAGFPDDAGGTFVQGGTVANLSALVAARHRARGRRAYPAGGEPRWVVAASSEAHSSIKTAATVMDVEMLTVDVGPTGRFDGAALELALDGLSYESGFELFAVVGTAGTTNLGLVEDLASLGEIADERGAWFHVDGAYGCAALAAASVRSRFDGIERADSFVVDPHKWLFAPFDCAALVYRNPEEARDAHAQHAGYLEPLQETGNWNPSDFAIQLTRRARGLPFWFSLATFGTSAYSAAIERTLEVARHAARAIRARPSLELVSDPQLSVVCFRRLGWDRADYYRWSGRLLAEGVGFVTPTTVRGDVAARFAIVNPVTTEEDIDLILDTMQ